MCSTQSMVSLAMNLSRLEAGSLNPLNPVSRWCGPLAVIQFSLRTGELESLPESHTSLVLIEVPICQVTGSSVPQLDKAMINKDSRCVFLYIKKGTRVNKRKAKNACQLIDARKSLTLRQLVPI